MDAVSSGGGNRGELEERAVEEEERKDGVQRVSWNDSLSVMRARTKESPLYTTECSVYYTNGQWLTPPPIETNTWDVYARVRVCVPRCRPAVYVQR